MKKFISLWGIAEFAAITAVAAIAAKLLAAEERPIALAVLVGLVFGIISMGLFALIALRFFGPTGARSKEPDPADWWKRGESPPSWEE